EQATSDLSKAVEELKLQEGLRTRVIGRLTELERYPDVISVPVDVLFPDPTGRIDSVIRVEVTSLTLDGPQAVNPTLRLHLRAIVEIFERGSLKHSRAIVLVGKGHTLLTWADDDAKCFKEEVGRQLERLAEKIVAEVFSRPRPVDVTRAR